MKKFINKLLVNHSLIYKLFLYVATIILVVYLFPKGGQFKYEFQKGKPWEYENYYAPFDFAIQKTEDEIALEKQQVIESSKQFYEYDENVVLQVKNSINEKIENALLNSDLIQEQKIKLRELVNIVVKDIYEFGYIETPNNIKNNKQLITLKMGNKSQDIEADKLFKSSEIF